MVMAVKLYRLRMAITGAFIDQTSLAMAVNQSGHDLNEITAPDMYSEWLAAVTGDFISNRLKQIGHRARVLPFG